MIKKLGGADAAIAVAVAPKAFEQAYRSLRRGGTLVFVALPADNSFQLPIFETVLNGTKIVGSIVGTRVDLASTTTSTRPGAPAHGTAQGRRALWALRRRQMEHYLRTGTMLPA